MATAILALALGASAQSIDDLNFYADVTGTFPRIWPICNTTVVDSLLQAAPDFCRSTLRDQLFSNGPILDIASCDCLLNVNKTELESDLGFCRASDKSLDPVRRAYSTFASCSQRVAPSHVPHLALSRARVSPADGARNAGEARQSTPTCTAQQVDESVENAQPYCKSVIAQYASDEQAEKTYVSDLKIPYKRPNDAKHHWHVAVLTLPCADQYHYQRVAHRPAPTQDFIFLQYYYLTLQ